MSYFWTRFSIPGGFYPQSCAKGWYATVSCKYKENWGWQLVWQMTSSDEQWQHSQMHLLEFMWLVSSEFVEIRSVIWPENFTPYQTTFMYVVNAPKKYFCFCTCCVCLYQACAAVFSMHTTGTNDVVSQVWTLTPLALLPSMWRIVGKNRKKKKLLVGQAKCEYWI